jgi:hypothetical protein
MNKREKVEEILKDENPDALFLDGFDDAIVGIVRRIGLYVVAYDEDVCLQILIKGGMDWEEACEYFEYNVKGASMGEHTPVFFIPVRSDSL